MERLSVYVWSFVILVVSSCAGHEHQPELPAENIEVAPSAQSDNLYRIRELTAYALQEQALVRLEVWENESLFAPGYTEKRIGLDGELLHHPKSAWANARACHFHGWSIDLSTDLVLGPVAVSICNRREELWSGLVLVGRERFSLHGDGTELAVSKMEPLELEDDGLAMFDVQPFVAFSSEAVPIPESDGITLDKNVDSDPLAQSSDENAGTPLYIELGVANDHARFSAHGANTEQETAAIVNALAILYEHASDDIAGEPDFEPDMEIVLVEQVTFEGPEPWDASPQVDSGEIDELALLYSFLQWAQPNMKGDNFQLFSHLNFSGKSIGKAFVRSMCVYEHSGAVIQTTHSNAADASVCAHEMGHNLGMVHDGTSTAQGDATGCNPSDFIMSATSNVNVPQSTFSTCSKAALQNFVASGLLSCLENTPPAPGGECGDGVLNLGEDCDCGQLDCSEIDPCCHGATCHGVTGNRCRDADSIDGACFRGKCVTTTEYCDGVSSRTAGAIFEAANQCNTMVDDCSRLFCLRDGEQCTYFQREGGPLSARDYTPCAGGQCLNGVCVQSDGLPDYDECPEDGLKIEAGICGCGTSELDSDGDGTPNCIDDCSDDPDKTAPGECGCGVEETDSDADESPDCIDECPTDPFKQLQLLCGCGVSEDDVDGDGTPNCVDLCPMDPGKVSPDFCGCGEVDLDDDGDGAPNCVDQCPSDANKTETGQCGCGESEVDTDGDGAADCIDECVVDPEKTERGECGCGEPDLDSDGDGVSDCLDECPDNADMVEVGRCGCETEGRPDASCPMSGDVGKISDIGTVIDGGLSDSDYVAIDGWIAGNGGEGGFMFEEPDSPNIGCDCSNRGREGRAPEGRILLLILGIGLLSRRRFRP